MSVWQAVFSLLLALPLAILSFPDKVPNSACGNMIPGHEPYKPATGPSPYKLQMHYNNASADTSIPITIVGWRYHEGLMVQAQDVNSGAALGSWKVAPGGLTKVMTCFHSNDTVTHSSGVHKNETTLSWLPPKNYSGTVVFKATVVGSYSMFWTGLTSTRLNVATK